MDLDKTIKSLERRRFKVSHFETGELACKYVASQVNNTEVGIGGSKTVEALGLYDTLTDNNKVYWHWKEPGPETLKKANSAPVYICSANAVTEDGQIINIDGTGNRLAACSYGTKKVYFIIGTNKICSDFDSAVSRARNVAAVQNANRFPVNTPCKIDGKCHDCASPQRICNSMLVTWGPMNNMDIEVIIVDEELGY